MISYWHMEYSLSKSGSGIGPVGKVNYLAHMRPGVTYGVDDLSKALADTFPGGAATVKYYEELRQAAIQAALRDGKAVRIGGVNLVPVVQGGFSSIDGEFDPSHNQLLVTAFTSGDLKKCLKGIVPENVEAAANPMLSHIKEESAEEEELLVSGSDVSITGRKLKVDVTAADEGVALEDVKTGEVKAQAAVELSNYDTLVCSFASLPSAGRYLMVVKTRSGLDREHKVVRAVREIRVGASAGKAKRRGAR